MKSNPKKDASDEMRARYAAWYDEQVRLGLENIEAGRVVSHEDVVKKSAELLAELEKNMNAKRLD